MAYVKHEAIHSKGHLYSAFNYDAKKEKVTLTTDNHLSNLFSYASSDGKTYLQLMSFINCNMETIDEDFEMAKIIHNKPDKVVAHQYFQSFKPGEGTPELVHKIGVELAEKIAPLYQVAVYTHVDRAHLHNHIIINSVNIETGYKYIANKESLRHVRAVSDELCRKYGLSIIEPDMTIKPLDRETYKTALQGKSWKVDLSVTLDKALLVCQSKREFISYLEKSGYEVKYYNDNITVRKEGEAKSIRVDTLAKQFGEKYKKESIENKIAENSKAVIPERDNDPLIESEETRKAEVAEYKKENLKILRLVDEAVKISRSQQEFINYFRDKGYEIKYQNANISIKSPTMQKARRIDTLAKYYGKRYTKESIEERIKANGTWKFDLKNAIDNVLKDSVSREHFSEQMAALGYEVDYGDTDAMITLSGTKEYITLSALSKTYNGDYSLNVLDKKFMRNNPDSLHRKNYDDKNINASGEIRGEGSSKGRNETEWQRYARWYFKQKDEEEKRNIADPDLRLIDTLKRSILYSRNMNMIIVRLAVLSALFMSKDRRLKYKQYKEWKKQKVKNPQIKRPVESKVIQNINYNRLIESDGENIQVRVKPQQVSLLFNKPLFYSAKIYQDGRAYVTIKAHDESLLYSLLNIDSKQLIKDYDIQAQHDKYRQLKAVAQGQNTKLHYIGVDETQLSILQKESLNIAYFVNEDNLSVCYLPSDEQKIYTALHLENEYEQKQQKTVYRNIKALAVEQGEKVKYTKVSEEMLHTLKRESFPMAYFVNDDGTYNVSYLSSDDERLSLIKDKEKAQKQGNKQNR